MMSTFLRQDFLLACPSATAVTRNSFARDIPHISRLVDVIDRLYCGSASARSLLGRS